MATLSDRIKEAIEQSGVSVAEIARTCGISEQAVYGWTKGDTKELMGNNLVELADVTGFEARWIAKETGPKRRAHVTTAAQAHVLHAMEHMTPYQINVIVQLAETLARPMNPESHTDRKAAR